MSREPEPSAQNVTAVGASPAADRAFRTRAYLVSMSLRVLCFLAAIFIPAPMPLRVTFIAGAVLLPYFAVVIANGARRRSQSS